MRDEVLSSVGAQNMNTNGYQVSNQEYFDFHCDDPDLNKDAVSKPGTDTFISPTAFYSLERGGLVRNPILLDDERDKENSPTTTPSSEKPNRPLPYCEVEHLEQDPKLCLIEVTGFCFSKFYRACILIKVVVKIFQFFEIFFKTSQKFVGQKQF